ncbi:MAG: HAD family hydrolase [Acidobacteriota bacterium]
MSTGLAFVFDLDGVIVDSNRVHAQTWREYLRRCGLEAPEGFDLRMFGRRNDDIVADAFGEDLTPAEVFRHGAEKEKLYREIMRPVLGEHLVPGIAAFLERHPETPKAIATNGEPANADFVIDTGGLRPYFRVVINGHQVERPKPDPEIYFKAAELLSVAPANCIVFEDSVAGVEAARASGARVVAVLTTHTVDELPRVDASIRDFTDPELETWLSAQKAV